MTSTDLDAAELVAMTELHAANCQDVAHCVTCACRASKRDRATLILALTAEVRRLQLRNQLESDAMTRTGQHLRGMVDVLEAEARRLTGEVFDARVRAGGLEAALEVLADRSAWGEATNDIDHWSWEPPLGIEIDPVDGPPAQVFAHTALERWRLK